MRWSAALESAGIETFVTERRDGHLVFGIDLDDRPGALQALSSQLDGVWYVEYDIGSSTGLTSLGRAHRSRRVQSARAWRIFQLASWGELAVGAEQAAELTFWGPGASGQLELVGTRGHARFDERSPVTEERLDGRVYPGRRAFPVGADLAHVTEPIDVVYTWVDGADPVWQQAFRAEAERSGRNLAERAFDPARFTSRDELRYSLRSVWAYAGWVRHIYVVSAGQRPSWLADDPRITLVDHSDILPADALPTFNSHSIESALHRIDGLAEQFIYFNDDVFLGRPLRPEQFFTSGGLPWVFLSEGPVPGYVDESSLDVDRAGEQGRELLAQRFGRVARGKPFHTPFPLLRSVFADIEREFPNEVMRTERSRFRAPTDLSIPSSLAQLYSLATGRGVLGEIVNDYVHVESGRLDWHLDRIRLGRSADTFCINETEQQASDRSATERMIRTFLDDYFPIAAPWESDAGGAVRS